MLNAITVSKLKNIKLKSALCTTHGGVKRDQGKSDEALALGEQAHQLTPKDFRPCTLLGAVNMEIGNHTLGESWYEKAIERGASEKSVDDDLRSIFMRAEHAKREELRAYLLRKDPYRYSWAKQNHRKGNVSNR
jgi:Flp pilus assembly protein TadD